MSIEITDKDKTPSERDLHANVTLVSYDFAVGKRLHLSFFPNILQ